MDSLPWNYLNFITRSGFPKANYEECLSIEIPSKDNVSKTRTKFCEINFKHIWSNITKTGGSFFRKMDLTEFDLSYLKARSDKFFQQIDLYNIELAQYIFSGICLPRTCQSNEVELLVNKGNFQIIFGNY